MLLQANTEDRVPEALSTTEPVQLFPYRHEAALIDWDGNPISAIVIEGLANENGYAGPVTMANRLLAEHSYLSAGLWAVFVKLPAHLPAPQWKLLGTGSGKQLLDDGAEPGIAIPEAVIRQLETNFTL